MNQDSTIRAKFLRNPEVVLREEDDDGGLLFNPDTNQVKVVNSTGLFIWKQCDGSRNLSDICLQSSLLQPLYLAGWSFSSSLLGR